MCILPAGSLAGIRWSVMAPLIHLGSQLGQPEWLRLLDFPLHMSFHLSLIRSMLAMVCEETDSYSCKASSDLALKV